MKLKIIIKKILLKFKKQIILDSNSKISYQIINRKINSKYPCYIHDSICDAIEVSEGVKIIEARLYGKIKLGRFVSISGPGTTINAIKQEVEIRDFSSIGQNVSIVNFNHSYYKISSSFIKNKLFEEVPMNDMISKGKLLIEEDVWIGSNCVILTGVTIGRGSIIGAGSIVTKDIPRYSIVFGNPAKIYQNRFSYKTIEYLENLKWWEWNIEKMKRNKELFEIIIDDINLDELRIFD
jgi:virginiamycin A acetyltransferase